MLSLLLRSNAEVSVLGVALFNDGLHLREIARRAHVSFSEAKKELDTLVRVGILKSERRGNQVIFFVDDSCAFLQDLKNLYLKTEGVFSHLSKVLRKVRGVEYAFVFGSFAGGREKKNSDVDLMVVGDVDENVLNKAIFSVQKKVSREINFVHWSLNELEKRAREENIFLKTLLREKKVWLLGDGHEFIGIAGQGLGSKNRARRKQS